MKKKNTTSDYFLLFNPSHEEFNMIVVGKLEISMTIHFSDYSLLNTE